MAMYDLSYDPKDPLFDVPNFPGVRWGIQVFTLQNCYGLNPEKAKYEATDSAARLSCTGLSWAGQQQRSDGRVDVRLEWQAGVLIWQIQGWHAEAIKSMKLQLWGLPAEVLDQGWWNPITGANEVFHPQPNQPIQWTYPLGWVTPWACVGGNGNAISFSVRDEMVREKRLFVNQVAHANYATVVELVCDQDALQYSGHFTVPEIRIKPFLNQVEVDADFESHLAFVERAYDLQPWATRPDVLDWAREVRLVVNLHGQHWTGYVFNTFDQMAETLRFVTAHIPARYVAAYLPGWEGRYYFQYPLFKPGEAMGGDAGFRRLVGVAQELGVRLMPMVGAHGANAQLYPDFENAVFRSRTNTYARLLNYPDWDGDRTSEDDQIFLNTGEPNFRRHLIEEVSQAVIAYDLEIVYFDTTAAWANDPRYNLYEGYKALIRELNERHPGLMIAGEGWWDALLALFPINLSWMGVSRSFRYPQMLARYGRALQHLMEGAPGLGSTGVFEGGYTPADRSPTTPGHIPSISFVDDTLNRFGDEVIALCRQIGDRV